MFAKSQALKKPNGVRTAGGSQPDIDLSGRHVSLHYLVNVSFLIAFCLL